MGTARLRESPHATIPGPVVLSLPSCQPAFQPEMRRPSSSAQKPASNSRPLYAGRRLPSHQAPDRLVPEEIHASGFGDAKLLNDASSMGSLSFVNIAEPMRAWRMQVCNQSAAALPKGVSAGSSQPLALPDKPSIAVLPFTNMSGDPEQELFCRRHGGRHHHCALKV